ncbi:hypothetical protein DTL42_07955 [Bremerella cremea]|uniref:Uncharacterized protein n=1 Tax=Bremerella cremea TaxID=1031537 RepID=A0A368KVK1_9BACT|nr:hypothetical protein [Bremerella cremea]RCS52761.1 hypothetical protein DTL42_07955 [Bremerella cremea]
MRCIPSLLAVALLVHVVSSVKAVDANDFEFARPFVESLDEGMSCEVRYDSGRLLIEVTLPDQQLVPRRGTGLPMDEKIGPWRATFLLVPILGAEDLKQMEALAISGDSKQGKHQPTYAHFAVDSYWFRVGYPLYAPREKDGRQKVEKFVQRLSEKAKTLSGTDASPLISRLLVAP